MIPTIKMTLAEYDALPGVSGIDFRDTKVGAMWKITKLINPDNKVVVKKTSEKTVQYYWCEIIEEVDDVPTIRMTLAEYDALPDYSIEYPKNVKIGVMWKITEFVNPGERIVIEKMSETTAQYYRCEIIEEKDSEPNEDPRKSR